MNSRETVRAAIDHVDAARVPYYLHLCPEAWEAWGASTGVADPEDFLDNDILPLSPVWWSWHELDPTWREMDPPTTRPTVRGHGNYDTFGRSLAEARENAKTRDKYFLVQIYGSHFEKAYFSRGIENFLADLGGEPEFARGLLDLVIEKNLVMLENMLAFEEIDGVLLGSDWGSQQDLLMSPDIWEEMIRPGEQREYDLIHSYNKDVWVHSCGNIERIIPSLIEMGLDVLNPIQPEAMDIAKLKADYGEKLAFWGGVSTQQTLPFGSPEEVRAEARAVRETMSAGGGYILAPAQSIQDDVPLENLQAFLEVAREGRA